MLYREIMAVCSEIHTKHVNTAVWAERRVLRGFVKLWKATVRFVLSVHMEQLGSHWTDFQEIYIWEFFFLKSVMNNQVWLKYEKNNGHFT